MKVSELAKRAGVSADTVRHYTKIGLLKPGRNPQNQYKEYGESDYKRLRFAQKARLLGFSLKDITEIIAHADNGETPCPMVRSLIVDKAEAIARQIRELQLLCSRMELAAKIWRNQPDNMPDGNTICHLIEDWDDTEFSLDQ